MAKSLPYSKTKLTALLEKRILEMRPRKNQVEIATEAGFVNTNMLSMIKAGKSRLPLDRVPALAKALECDASLLFRLAIEQSGSETILRAVEEIFGTVVSRNEVVWLEEIRNASEGSDPTLTSRARAAIRGIFGK
jgi:hypothetical protein